MRFNGISIITDNYEEMVNFYKELLQVEVKDEGDYYKKRANCKKIKKE